MCTLIVYLGFMGNFFFNCLVGYFNMIVLTPAVSSVLYVCVFWVVFFLYLHLFSAIEHVSHGKAL